jgi:prepilin-type N-terminal cleavage/methylation domain-containing protein
MKRDGVTLIELIIVISIIGILAVALGFNFAGWMARYQVESQIKTMHSDLMYARQRAMEKKIQYVAQLPAANGNSYTICEDTNGNNSCDSPSETTNSSISQSLSKSSLRYLITWNVPGGAGGSIVMSTRGMIKTAQGAGTPSDIDNTNPYYIWLLNPETMAAYGLTATNTSDEVDYDCISLCTTRIDVGKYNGATCVVK